jgi:CheY-like chemotaxis protein
MLDETDRDALMDAFTGDAQVRAEQVERGLTELSEATSGDSRARALTSLAFAAHNLRGAAATVGLSRIEALAAELESMATGPAVQDVVDDRVVDVAERLLADLRDLESSGGGIHLRAADAGTSPATVLHIEDNDANLVLVERVLARRPHVTVVEARNGAAGVALARDLQPSLILLDLRLPDIAGDEVLRRLRADPSLRHIPVVVISAEARPAETDRLLASGADAYLVKPIHVHTLLEVVDALLAKAAR